MKEQISVCICTFRRAALFDTLRSLSELKGIEDYDINVVVSDNDDTDALRLQVVEYAIGYRYKIHYVHAPAKNISIARNAALANARGKWAAFIDDDEEADRWWLSALLENRKNAVAVVGQCIARYPDNLPDWLQRCDFHSARITDDPTNGYTGNVLLDREFLQNNGILFRLELGQTGGEDTIFFREIDRAGGSINYCAEAIIYETVIPSRATMAWVRRRNFRTGQTHALMCREFKPDTYRWLLLTSGLKSLASLTAIIVFILSPVRSRCWQARFMFHVGAILFFIWPKVLKEYK